MNVRKTRNLLGGERGSAMIMGAFGVILSIMFMALMIDMGLYYNSYRRLKSAADTVDEEIALMLPYYAYSGDYVTAFNDSLNSSLTNLGYSSDNLVSSSITRRTGIQGGWLISVETNIELEDTYQCMFAFIIGINDIPIRVVNDKIQNMGTDEPFNGGDYEVWD